MVTLEQADGAITHLQYNELGQRSVIIDAEGRQQQFQYDINGKVATVQDGSKRQLKGVYR